MNPLEKLLEQGKVTEAFVKQVEEIVKTTGHSYETVLLEQGASEDLVRDLYADYYQVPKFIMPEQKKF